MYLNRAEKFNNDNQEIDLIIHKLNLLHLERQSLYSKHKLLLGNLFKHYNSLMWKYTKLDVIQHYLVARWLLQNFIDNNSKLQTALKLILGTH